MSLDNKWVSLKNIHRDDQKLISMALSYVKQQPSPESMFLEIAHSGEIDIWREIDSSSIDAFAAAVSGSHLFVLTDSGIAYYLPVLLGLCFMRADGHFQDQLLDQIENRMGDLIIFLDKKGHSLCLRMLNRIVEISVSNDPLLEDTYPGLVVSRNPELKQNLIRFKSLARYLEQ